jgi:integrase
MTLLLAPHEAPGLEQVEDGTHSVSFQGHLFQEPSFDELADHYLNLQAVNARDQTRKNAAGYIRAALEWMNSRGIARPNTSDWKAYLDWRQHPTCGKRLTRSSVDSHRAVLQRVYKRCAQAPKRGWMLIPNPLAPAFLPPYAGDARDAPRSIMDPYVTYPLLLAAMPDPVARALVAVLRWHGLRIQEALGIALPGSKLEADLHKHILNLDAGTLTIECQRTRDSSHHGPLKTDYSKATVSLVEPAAQALREALQWRKQQALRASNTWMAKNGVCAQNYVFPYYRMHLDELMERHREIAPGDFKRRVVGVDGGDAWHVYRHTFATEHYRNWPGAVSEKRERLHSLLRHKDVRTTGTYLRALALDVVEGDDIDESVRRQLAKQAQAIAERSGKGLQVVKP